VSRAQKYFFLFLFIPDECLFTQRYYSSSRDSLAAAYVNRAAAVSSTASELDLSRKARRRDLRGRLKLPPTVALASSVCGNEPPLLGPWGLRGASGGGPGGTGKFSSASIWLHLVLCEIVAEPLLVSLSGCGDCGPDRGFLDCIASL
jgi:hypothetical protein